MKIDENLKVSLKEYTLKRCQSFWKDYVADPDMWDKPYAYDASWVENYYKSKVLDKDRCFFAICLYDVVIGEIQLKSIDKAHGSAVMSVHLSCDKYKNRGLGTEAERLMIRYAFDVLGLHTIYADCVLRNKRSMHVLEKLGFKPTHEDDEFRYYKLHRV